MSDHTLYEKHLYRAFGLLLAGFVGFLAFRGFMLPENFGEYGMADPADLERQKDHPMAFLGREKCKECHPSQYEMVTSNSHAVVQCENCHDAYTHHDNEKGERIPMEKNRSYTLCARCHEYLLARPKSQPQVDLLEHLGSMGMKLDDEVCVTCHRPHNPKLGGASPTQDEATPAQESGE